MKRKAEDSLSRWFLSERRKPLVLRGARQVGKSTLVRRVASGLGVPLWELNLERHASLAGAFTRLDVPRIVQEMELVLRTKLGKGPGILFLDEIQAIPQALAALRYFHEERPDLPVVAAGSLLEFALARFQASMPVGRIEFFHLGPVDFLEFVRESDGDGLADFVESWRFGESWPDTVQERLSGHLRDFMIAGAMPEASASFAANRDVQIVQEVHRSILETYREDFGKYSTGADSEKVRHLFDAIPPNIGQKLRWARVNPAWKSVDLRRAFDLLEQAGVVAGVRHSDGSGVPLGASATDDVFKVLFLDGGLAQTAMGLPPLSLEAFESARFVNEGPMAEQFVGQHLRHRKPGLRPQLHYWLREGKSSNAEVDFLIQVDDKIVPVEVKSGTSGSLRSLHQFMAVRGLDLAVRFDLLPPSLQNVATTVPTADGPREVRYRLLSLPLGLVQQVDEIVRSVG